MRIPVLALLAGLLLGATACAPTTTAWQDFRMPGADFAVSMPTQPKVYKDETERDGTISRGYMVDQGTVAYTTHYTVFPPPGKNKKTAPLDQLLDNTRDHVVREMKATLRKERRFSLNDARATELIFDVPATAGEAAYTVRARYYLRRNGTQQVILYQTLVTLPSGGDASPSVARFLDSFHFVTG